MSSTLFLVAVFGVLGIFSRFGIQTLAQRLLGHPSPWSTFSINLLGSLAIGIVYVFASERELITPGLKTALVVGLLGGFTTFSSFSLDTLNLWEQGKWGAAAVYFVASPVLGVLCTALAIYCVRRFF